MKSNWLINLSAAAVVIVCFAASFFDGVSTAYAQAETVEVSVVE